MAAGKKKRSFCPIPRVRGHIAVLTAFMLLASFPHAAYAADDPPVVQEGVPGAASASGVLTRAQMAHKETMLYERAVAAIRNGGDALDAENAIELGGAGGDVPVSPAPDADGSMPDVHYVCYDGVTDYLIAVSGSRMYVYYVRITSEGTYYLSRVRASGEALRKFRAMAVPENRATTEEFWNHVTLSRPEGDTDVHIRPVDSNGVMMVPYFNQGSGYYMGNGEWACQDWPNVTFNVNGHTMHEAGCGFFSTAMALSYLKQEIIAPVDFKENGQYIDNKGSAVTVGVATAASYGVNAYFTGDLNEVIEALRNGHPVMAHVGKSVFTNGGHYILLVGYLPDGTFAVNDPGHMDNTYFYNGKTFPGSVIMDAVAQRDVSTGFTIFE